MTSQAIVDALLAEKTLAFVGLSRSGKKFSNLAFKELKARGYRLLPVHPAGGTLEGEACATSLSTLSERAGAAIVMVPPGQSEKVVREAAEAGIMRVWLQQGGSSPEAVRAAEETGVSLVHGECVLMFAPPVKSFHRFHRFLWRVLGKLPRA